MPLTIRDLLKRKAPPVVARMQESAREAFDRMGVYKYSQLPVLADGEQLVGVITAESILSACKTFRTSMDALRVSAAVEKAPTYEPDEDLFDLLDDLKEEYAALIVDAEGKLVGVITQYDLVEFFRTRAEDMLHMENIELSMRDHVRRSFSDGEGRLAVDDLARAIDEVDDATILRSKFIAALRQYLERAKLGAMDEAVATEAFKAFGTKPRAKELHDLTFEQAKQLLFHRSRWPQYQQVFGIEAKLLGDLLDRVRDARNRFVHFRGVLDEAARKDTRFCADWLARHPPPEPMPSTSSVREKPAPAKEPVTAAPTNPAPAAVRIDPDDEQEVYGGRYARLAAHLESLRREKLALSFEEIERIIGGPLPPGARRHRAWWANDSVSHAQSRLWLEAGWRVASVNMTAQRAVFSRIDERQEDYIDFFSRLRAEFASEARVNVRSVPNGSSWLPILWLPSDDLGVPVVCSFARGGRFRIELYIDLPGGDGQKRQQVNKRIFEKLMKLKGSIESQLGTALSWEPLERRTASRIALYHDGSILDDETSLGQLRKWACQWLPRFCAAMEPSLRGALAEVR